MNSKHEYLSDDSLDLLIAQVEQSELVTAPPELKQNILERVRTKEELSRKEYYEYCFRVAVSVAAAVVLVFALPDLKRRSTLETIEIPGTETIFTVEKQNGGVFENYFNGTKIFDQRDEFGIFQ